MRSGGVVVGGGGAGGAHLVAMLDETQDIFCVTDCLLPQAHHLHLLLAILQYPQLQLLVQQVKHLATVDLKEACSYH